VGLRWAVSRADDRSRTGRTDLRSVAEPPPRRTPAPGGSDDPRRYHSVRRAGARVVPHLHGGNVEHESDGKPQAWFTRDFEQTGPDFEKKDYYYANEQPPATLWYHDHSLGITRLNVYAGLAGFYLLRNDHERELDLPTSDNEIPLVLQDRSFNEDGSLYYPTDVPATEEDENDSHPDPSIVPQFYGDTSTVNGKAWPRLSVDPEQYRFRLLNGANSRYYNLKLLEYDEESGDTGEAGRRSSRSGTTAGSSRNRSRPLTASNSDRVSARTSSSTSVSTRARPCSYIITPRRSIAGRAESGRTTPNPSRRSCLSTWQPRRASRSQRNSQTN